MDRLYVKSKDRAQKAVEGLYRDLERRIAASPAGQCPVDMAAAFLRMCHAQSCGKCVPCRTGLGQLQNMLEDILSMDTNLDLHILDTLERTAKAIKVSADCAIGFEAASMVLRGLEGFREDYESHILNHACADNVINHRESVPCRGACPAGVDVPGYTALVHAGRYDDAVRLIRKDNPFPTVCALICEHPCEDKCRRNIIDAPINIRGLKRFAVDNCSETVPVPERMDHTGKKIAVVGGGPSGLSAAYFLSIMGHDVTVFEKRAQLGGMLRYGIPSYRLPRERLQWDIDAIASTGVEFRTDYDVESEEAIREIKENYDAMYLSIGSHNHKNLGIPGEYAKGVVPAVEMLRGIGDDSMPDFNGKSVIIVGGGNVAMDVARTAKRLGASEVCIVYRRRRDDMTALPDEIGGAVAEGCQLMELMAPSEIIVDKNGNVKGLYVQPQIAGEADKSGRPRPVAADLPRVKMRCDIVISAIGQATDFTFFEQYGVPVFRGNIKTEKSSVVDKVQGIYAGGDCVTGPSTVINAVAAGKVAAANIDNYLGYNHEITIDIDIPVPPVQDQKARGRIELKERYASERGGDFGAVELPMTREESLAECARCLRCDACGFGSFRGGRIEKW
ncbi:NAD(P)-binding protein [Anaerovoracaceae bacterium 42-11]|nr:NAD(P)-binding protein [Emergencia sp.]